MTSAKEALAKAQAEKAAAEAAAAEANDKADADVKVLETEAPPAGPELSAATQAEIEAGRKAVEAHEAKMKAAKEAAAAEAAEAEKAASPTTVTDD